MPQKKEHSKLEERIKALELENGQLREKLEHFDLNCLDNKKRILSSRGLLQIVLDSIPVRIFWKDLDLKYLGCNKLFAIDAGLQSPEEIIGKNDFELSWSNEAELYRADDKEVMETDSPKLNYEEPQTSPDGTELLLRTSKIPLKDKSGSVFGVMGCYEDITEYRQAEAAIKENAHFLQILLNAIPNPVFYKNKKGVYTGCNQAFEAFLGLNKEEIIGKSVYDLSPKELADKYFQKDQELFDNPGIQTYDSSVMDKAGIKHDVVFNKATFEKADGTLAGLVGVIIDITERKQTEGAIQALIESSVGRSGSDFFEKTIMKLCKWLKADSALIGELKEGHVVIRSMIMDGTVISDFSYELKDAPCEMVIKEGFCHFPKGVASLFPEDKDLVDMGAEGYAGVLLHDKNKKPLGVLCVVSRQVMPLPPKTRDVMEIIAAKASVEIEHLRTVGKLKKAKDKADIASNAKSKFLSQMSHELRTPLTAILGFAQVLTEDPEESLTHHQKDCMKEIMTSGWHLFKIINELLDLSTIESGKVNLSIDSMQAKPILLNCIRLISPMAEKKGITINDETDLSHDVMIEVDRTRLKQILINLLSNAVKYNCKKGSVTISSEQIENKRLKINITDVGHGISREEQTKIFEPFHRSDAYARGIDGTGIGLSISKDFVELMGGHIGVISEPGNGSTFWIELNLSDAVPQLNTAKEDIPKEEILKEEILKEEIIKPSKDKFKVLYVEDNLSNLKFIEIVLSSRPDLEVITAEASRTGLELAKKHRPHIIMLDINMPDLNGYEMLEQLKNIEETSNIPVLAISAYAMKKDVEKGLAAGFYRYLTKPINKKDLMEAIDYAIIAQQTT